MYNTESATRIASWICPPFGAYRNSAEILFTTKNGAFFLYIEYRSGMATSTITDPIERPPYTDHKIIPLCEEGAKWWIENRLDADVYISYFGLPEEATKHEAGQSCPFRVGSCFM
jgi:hypothetical protein